MWIQEPSMSPLGDKGEKSKGVDLDYHIWRSTVSSRADSGHGWSEGDTGQNGGVTGMLLKMKRKQKKNMKRISSPQEEI